jgi:type II secretory pathway component PulJ
MRADSGLQCGGTRRGFTVLEVSLSLTILLSAAILMTQFLVASAQQQRICDQRRIALEELANRMERMLAAKYEDVNAAAMQQQELSPEILDRLPAAKLTARVTDEAGLPASKLIRLEISWEQRGDRVTPLGLTAWRYPQPEARP